MWPWLPLAVLVSLVGSGWAQQCGGGVSAVITFSCGAMPAPQCQQAAAPLCPAQTTCVVQQQQACCCPAAPPPPPPQPVVIPVVTVMVPPGASCPLPYQQCGGGSQCQYTLNLAVCTCPAGQQACNGVCQGGNACPGPQAVAQSGCVIGAGDWCGPSTNPRCNCVSGATCGPHVGAGIYLCLCQPGLNRRGKACLPY